MDNKTLLHQRYAIQRTLGHGGFAITYLAIDTHNQQQCVVKCLSFHKVEEWKTLELFEREARILKNLDHPRIPKYIDFFTLETEHDLSIYLVQEYVDGKNLTELVQAGKHFHEQNILKIALKISRILEYLHGLSPPIIHRDIKPSNIILTPDNLPFLVDFGAVRETLFDDARGVPTIVGTYGYMPLEQSEGRTVPASDIYALGMTLIYVLSHQEPSQMEKKGLRVDFRPHVNISKEFAAILDRMIAPDWQERYTDVGELRRDVKRLQSGNASPKASQRSSFRTIAFMLGCLILLLTGGGVFTYFSFRSPIPLQTEVPPPQINAPFIQPSPSPEPQRNAPVINLPPSPLPAEETPIVSPIGNSIRVDLYRDFTFIPEGFPLGLAPGHSAAGGLDTLPYEQLIREPDYRSKQVLYGYLPLGNGDDRQITFVLDELDRPNWVAYVDTNNNEDLTDDGLPYRNEGTGIFATEVTVQMEIVTLADERTIQPYTLWMWAVPSRNIVLFYARCHYAGKLLIEGTMYDAVIFEAVQHNGLYRDSGLWIDLNQDHELDEASEHFQHGATIRIGQTTYQVELLYP